MCLLEEEMEEFHWHLRLPICLALETPLMYKKPNSKNWVSTLKISSRLLVSTNSLVINRIKNIMHRCCISISNFLVLIIIFFICLSPGGHTIGTSACQFFRYRLYNFTTTGNGADPTINPLLLSQLRSLCPQNGDAARRVDLDVGSANQFDATFFRNLQNSRGILESDQKLWTDVSTKSFVQRFSGVRGLQALNFNVEFGRSMVKMSNIGVKSSTNGEIRRICSAIN